MVVLAREGKKLKIYRIPRTLVRILKPFLKPDKTFYGYFDYGFGWAVSGISETPYDDRPCYEIKTYKFWKWTLGVIRCCS